MDQIGESQNPSMTSKALCVFHESSVASVSCERCGDFICDECVQTLYTRQVCQSCYKNYGGTLLSDFRESLWGKRDGYVWLVGGVGSLFFMGMAALWLIHLFKLILSGSGAIIGPGELIPTFLFSLSSVITVAYFFLKKWARLALFLFPLTGFFAALSKTPDLPTTVGLFFLFVLLPLAFLTAGFTNPQNKLSFKMDVATDELETLFQALKSNRAAHNAFAISLLAFFVPPLLFLSFYLALRGRKNCDPEAWPPVGGMKEAQNALILSTLGFFLWIAILIFGAMP